MIIVNKNKAQIIYRKIVEQYGDGVLQTDKYIFEQITRLPEGISSSRMKINEAILKIKSPEVIVLLDPHPNNLNSINNVLDHLKEPDAFSFQISINEVYDVLSFDQCDMYITSTEGDLLIVGCHEDEVIDGEREVWVPVTQ